MACEITFEAPANPGGNKVTHLGHPGPGPSPIALSLMLTLTPCLRHFLRVAALQAGLVRPSPSLSSIPCSLG